MAGAAQAVHALALTTMRNVVGGLDHTAALHSRDRLHAALHDVLGAAGPSWGLRIGHIHIAAVVPTTRQNL